jgi:hypothetical protein
MWPFPQVNLTMLTICMSIDQHVIHIKHCLQFLKVGMLEVVEIICGDGMWHIDRCPPSFIVQHSTMQKYTVVKCATNINTHKMISGTLAPCYFGF